MNKAMIVNHLGDETVSMGTAPMVLTVPQMARALCISRNQAYELKDTPGFSAFRIGKRVLINKVQLQEWLNRQCPVIPGSE